MKLYATTTSERATKGQGGNKYLDIVIYDEKMVIIGNITLLPDNKMEIRIKDNMHTAYSKMPFISIKTYEELEKGKRQKGEKLKVVHKCYIEHTSGQYKGLSIPHYHE